MLWQAAGSVSCVLHTGPAALHTSALIRGRLGSPSGHNAWNMPLGQHSSRHHGGQEQQATAVHAEAPQ